MALPTYDKTKRRKSFEQLPKGAYIIQIKQANRRLENLLYALEVLSVLRGRDADFSGPWKAVLKNQFHDILCGTVCDGALVQAEEEYPGTSRYSEKVASRFLSISSSPGEPADMGQGGALKKPVKFCVLGTKV